MTARPAPAALLAAPLLAATLLLAGCGGHDRDRDGNATTASITIGNSADGNGGGNGTQSVAIDVPGFSAKVNVPNINLGTDATRIDDLSIFPGTKINGMKISGQAGDGSGGDGRGNVEMGFTAPGDPAKVVQWYHDQAQQQGWTIVPPSGANQFQATRTGHGHDSTQFALQVTSAADGSSGRLLVTGH